MITPFWHGINSLLSLLGKFAYWFIILNKRNQPTKVVALKDHTDKKSNIKSFIVHCQSLSPRALTSSNPNTSIDVSIIIPVYNQWKLTRACLNSILETDDHSVNYEIILADDCSTDETINAENFYPGLIIVKTHKNVGFLRNCNNAVHHARGRYILLLNNDTIVLPNWLLSLYNTLETDSTAAIVGSKVLYPKGTIQEAGVVLFRDGTTICVGRKYDRWAPLFNMARETDLIVGCSILIRKSFWDAVGGFDERYQHGYFEEYDLEMSARAQGMRVIYQPKSELVHFEHATYSSTLKNNHKHLSNNNKILYLNKWSKILSHQHLNREPWYMGMSYAERMPSEKTRKKRATNQLNILYYSPRPIHRANHGNRARIREFVQKFQEMGHAVHFALLESPDFNTDDLHCMQSMLGSIDVIPCKKLFIGLGLVPFDGWYVKGLGEHMRLLCDRYNIDMVICSYVYQSKLLEYVPQHILKVIDTHDKMSNRYELLRLNKLLPFSFSCHPKDEASYLRRADLVIGITEEETRYFESISGRKNALMISHLSEPKFLEKKFSILRHIGLIASNNSFNRPMVLAFLTSINQRLKDTNECGFSVHIVGEVSNGIKNTGQGAAIVKKSWIKWHGFVPNLSEFYAQMDLIISPMTCGTGINIKTVEAMAYGMPLLSTKHGSRGIETHDSMHQHEDIDALVDSLFKINDTPYELERLAALSRENYLDFYQKNQFGLEALFKHHKITANEQILCPTS